MRSRIYRLRKSRGKHFIGLILCLLIVLLGPISSAAQPAKELKPPAKTAPPKEPNPNLLRWRIVLDSLVQEARSVSPEERRPYALVDVADAYWEIDADTCRSLYESALDIAWGVAQKDKKYDGVLQYVIKSATKLDPKLANVLIEKLSKREGRGKDFDDIASETASDLLKTNPERAAEMAEAFAPNGLEDGSAVFFIFKLAEIDVSLSNRVYATYLNKAAANPNTSVRAVLPLAGYAFGYAEYHTISQNGVGTGAQFWQNDNVSANPELINPFLALAYRRIANAIELRNKSTGAELESLNYAIAFAIGYLVPEVNRFSPDTVAAWQELQGQGLAGVSPEVLRKISMNVEEIAMQRVKLQTSLDHSEKQLQDTEASLEGVEKLVGTCQRDVVYSRAVFTFSYRKKFKRAIELAGKIEGTKQSDMVLQVVAYDMASAAVESGEWDEAEVQIKKFSNPGVKAVAKAELGKALIFKGEKQRGEQLIDEAATLAEKLSEPKEKAGLLFGLSSILLKSNPPEARNLLVKAIKSLNKLEPTDSYKFSIPVRIPLGCEADGPEHWGDQSLPNSTIFSSIPLFAKENPDMTNSDAEAIADKITRIRSMAMVTKIALANLKVKPVR